MEPVGAIASDNMANGLGKEESKWVLGNVQGLSGFVGVGFIGFEAMVMELFREIDRSRREKELEESIKKPEKMRGGTKVSSELRSLVSSIN